MKSTSRLLILVLLALLLVACSGTLESAEPEEVEFTIEMNEFNYSPVDIKLKVGQSVTLNLVNQGQLEHELMIGRDVATVDSVRSGYEVDFFENAGIEPIVAMDMDMHMDDNEEGEHEEAEHEDADADHHEGEHEEDDHHEQAEHSHHGFMVSVPKENEATITFTVTEDMVGTWEMGCFLQGGAHYLANMTGSLVVEE